MHPSYNLVPRVISHRGGKHDANDDTQTKRKDNDGNKRTKGY